ncbi:MAG: hypothetical protein EXR47_03855 [Dehalococcoidia bacterium]|nr:hypothetical protein [Dehalococcoidia bacterium]
MQVNIQHSGAVTVTSPACIGIFAGATVVAPAPASGGTLIGCQLASGNVAATTGDALSFVLTRALAGDVALTIGRTGASPTQYFDGATGITPGATNTLQVTGVPLTLSSVAPASGPASGGTAVILTGMVFLSGATVSFGGTAATAVTVVNATTITATTPGHAAGAVNVVVTTGNVMTFVLTRVGTANPILSLLTGGAFGTQFTDGGTTIGPGQTNTLQVLTGVTVSGTVMLQGRTATFPAGVGHSIATVTMSPGNITANVAMDGTFQFANVGAGAVTFTALASGYLSAQRADVQVGSSAVTLPTVQLRAGLVNNDTAVTILDISAVVAAFGTSPPSRLDAQGRFVDQNGDGAVTINDIFAVVSSFGQSSPTSWP